LIAEPLGGQHVLVVCRIPAHGHFAVPSPCTLVGIRHEEKLTRRIRENNRALVPPFTYEITPGGDPALPFD
jgi:hypothetical protein